MGKKKLVIETFLNSIEVQILMALITEKEFEKKFDKYKDFDLIKGSAEKMEIARNPNAIYSISKLVRLLKREWSNINASIQLLKRGQLIVTKDFNGRTKTPFLTTKGFLLREELKKMKKIVNGEINE